MAPQPEYKDFKDALRDWTNRDIARTKHPAPPPSRPIVPHHIYAPRTKEPVVNGDIIREPIDRVAKRVVAPAPWYFQPPDVKREAQPEQPKAKTMKGENVGTINTGGGAEITTKGGENYIPGADEGGISRKIIGGVEYFSTYDIAVRIIDEINKHPQKLTPLARAALDARTVLDESMAQIGLSMDGFKNNLKKWLEDVRTARMNFVSETNYMMGPLKDIRQFFLDSTYESEIARLREFVELCERLQKLKQSGFLDTVADTMIRLAIKSEEK